MWNRMILVLGILVLLTGPTTADEFESIRMGNWHQWRGPNADGVSPNGNPPLQWDEATSIRWKVEIPGQGSATPIVWKDSVYILTAIDTGKEPVSAQESKANMPQLERTQEKVRLPRSRPDAPPGRRPDRFGSGRFGRGGMSRSVSTIHQFVILCLDKATGKEKWRQVVIEEVPHEGGHSTNTYASASPVTDGQNLYASFGSRGIYCYGLDGKFIWKRDLGNMRTRASFGEGASPAMHGDHLVVNWDHEGDSFITCLDAKTGTDRWKVERDEVTTWATPLIVNHNGTMQVVTNGTNRSRAYNLTDGTEIWQCGGQAGNPIASPVTTGELVFCMTGYRGYALTAIPLDAKGDITGTDTIAWTRDRGTPYIASPLLYDGLLYFTKSRNGILTCVEAKTGKELYSDQRLPGISSIYASIIGAAGKVYVVGRGGTTLVLQHGPEYKVLATNQLDDGIDATPVIVGKDLFLRGKHNLYCISE